MVEPALVGVFAQADDVEFNLRVAVDVLALGREGPVQADVRSFPDAPVVQVPEGKEDPDAAVVPDVDQFELRSGCVGVVPQVLDVPARRHQRPIVRLWGLQEVVERDRLAVRDLRPEPGFAGDLHLGRSLRVTGPLPGDEQEPVARCQEHRQFPGDLVQVRLDAPDLHDVVVGVPLVAPFAGQSRPAHGFAESDEVPTDLEGVVDALPGPAFDRVPVRRRHGPVEPLQVVGHLFGQAFDFALDGFDGQFGSSLGLRSVDGGEEVGPERLLVPGRDVPDAEASLGRQDVVPERRARAVVRVALELGRRPGPGLEFAVESLGVRHRRRHLLTELGPHVFEEFLGRQVLWNPGSITPCVVQLGDRSHGVVDFLLGTQQSPEHPAPEADHLPAPPPVFLPASPFPGFDDGVGVGRRP
ncbi:hypothetical protein BRC81_12475 [Halobacteriales archaeon QS_1_68_20]|nr:MAG: hypothetical protein BRC81_12475 [Halobacteriales archaeon QS_1_68_20]